MKRCIQILLIIVFFTVPMGAQFLTIPIGGFQLSLFRGFFLLLLIVVILSGRSVFKIFNENRMIIIFFLFWLAYACITIFWAKDTSNWLRMMYFLLLGVLAIIVCSGCIQEEHQFRSILFAFQAGIIIQSLIGWYEVISKNHLFTDRAFTGESIYVFGVRAGVPVAMQGNTNDFATLMFIGVFISLICIGISKRKIFKIANCIIFLSDIVLIFFTSSRANILALMLAAVCLLLLRGRRKLPIFICILIVGFVVINIPVVNQNLSSVLYFNLSAETGSDAVRRGLILNGFYFLLSTFGFGVGTGQIEYWMEHYAIFYHSTILNMHNWWMEILTAFGIPVFVGYIIFYVRLFRDLITKKKWLRKDLKIIPDCFCAIMIGFLIAAISSSSNFSCEWLWMFWGLVVAGKTVLSNSINIKQEDNGIFILQNKTEKGL